MGSIDIDRLLHPISKDAPAGASLRYEGTYDRIREARREDDATLPQGDWVTRLKTADWKLVIELCAEGLERRSKDLQLAVWLADAWVQLGGGGAVAPGLRLVAALCDRYWEELFPPGDDEGFDARVSLVEWLDDALARKLRMLPLIEGGEGQPRATLADWEAGRIGAADAAEGGPPGLLARISLVPRSRWTALRDEARAAQDAAQALERSLAARMERPPVVHRTRGALRSLAAAAGAALGEGGGEASPGVAERATATAIEPVDAGAPRAPGAPIRSRAEAYRLLTEAADYLLRTEPHSPVPYLVKRAIAWGNMSLAELLGEFVNRADDLVAIYRLLGMRGREEDDA
jgi:type VI secretion system protein ImpA